MDKRRIELLINGKPRGFAAPLSVTMLLEALGLPDRGVAVERNREIVKRDRFGDTWLDEGDALEIVTLVGGG